MPGQYYIYIPFSAAESNRQLVTAAGSWRENMGSYMTSTNKPEKRKAPKILERQIGIQALSGLQQLNPDEYTLYVMGHCNIGRKYLSNINMFVRERVEITAQELSLRMIEDGLPRNIKNLKLFACNGGAIDPAITGSALDSYGARLYWSLITRGIDKVELTAYTIPLVAATVDISTGHKRAMGGSRPSENSRRWPIQL